MSAEEMNMQELESQFNEQERLRREKLVQLQQEGKDPFDVYKVERTHSSQQVKDNFETLQGKEVTVVVRSGKIIKFESNNKIILKNNQNPSSTKSTKYWQSITALRKKNWTLSSTTI